MKIQMHFDFLLLALSKIEQDLEPTIRYFINSNFVSLRKMGEGEWPVCDTVVTLLTCFKIDDENKYRNIFLFSHKSCFQGGGMQN